MKLAGAIFDLDGTLVDSMNLWDRVPGMLVRGFGKEPAPDLAAHLAEMDLPEAAQYLIDTYGLDCTPRQVLERVNRLVDEEYRCHVELKPGADRLLEVLAKKGVPMCIATASEEHQARQAMERLGQDQHFSFVLSSSQYGPKTRPDIFLTAARRLGAQPGEVLVVEDALHAARTAKQAGFLVAGVYDPADAADAPALQQVCDWYLPRLDDEAFLARL